MYWISTVQLAVLVTAREDGSKRCVFFACLCWEMMWYVSAQKKKGKKRNYSDWFSAKTEALWCKWKELFHSLSLTYSLLQHKTLDSPKMEQGGTYLNCTHILLTIQLCTNNSTRKKVITWHMNNPSPPQIMNDDDEAITLVLDQYSVAVCIENQGCSIVCKWQKLPPCFH